MKLKMRVWENTAGLFVDKAKVHSVMSPHHFRIGCGLLEPDDSAVEFPALVSSKYAYLEINFRKDSEILKRLSNLGTSTVEVELRGSFLNYRELSEAIVV